MDQRTAPRWRSTGAAYAGSRGESTIVSTLSAWRRSKGSRRSSPPSRSDRCTRRCSRSRPSGPLYRGVARRAARRGARGRPGRPQRVGAARSTGVDGGRVPGCPPRTLSPRSRVSAGARGPPQPGAPARGAACRSCPPRRAQPAGGSRAAAWCSRRAGSWGLRGVRGANPRPRVEAGDESEARRSARARRRIRAAVSGSGRSGGARRRSAARARHGGRTDPRHGPASRRPHRHRRHGLRGPPERDGHPRSAALPLGASPRSAAAASAARRPERAAPSRVGATRWSPAR